MTATPDLGTDRLKAGGDEFYELLMKAHDGLSLEQSTALNARLILLMANRIADLETLTAILGIAQKTKTGGSQTPVTVRSQRRKTECPDQADGR